VWIFWNNFYRMCSEIKTESKWAKIIPPNAEVRHGAKDADLD
jgi:hypothetical protein